MNKFHINFINTEKHLKIKQKRLKLQFNQNIYLKQKDHIHESQLHEILQFQFTYKTKK